MINWYIWKQFLGRIEVTQVTHNLTRLDTGWQNNCSSLQWWFHFGDDSPEWWNGPILDIRLPRCFLNLLFSELTHLTKLPSDLNQFVVCPNFVFALRALIFLDLIMNDWNGLLIISRISFLNMFYLYQISSLIERNLFALNHIWY